MGGIDVLLAFPALVLALAFIAYLGQSVQRHPGDRRSVHPGCTRVARAATLAWTEREFVTAARAIGATDAAS